MLETTGRIFSIHMFCYRGYKGHEDEDTCTEVRLNKVIANRSPLPHAGIDITLSSTFVAASMSPYILRNDKRNVYIRASSRDGN